MACIKKFSTKLIKNISQKRTFALPAFNWEDPFDVDSRLTEEEKMIRDSAHAYAQEHLKRRVNESWLGETTDRTIFSEMGEMGLLGATIQGYDCSGVSQTAGGLICKEIERVDSGYRSMLSVQSSLVMGPINEFGSDELKEKFLPKLSRGELIGCFGLTEPSAGSDPIAMKTNAKKVDGGYLLNGEKMWISNSPIADVFVVWGKDENGHVRGFVMEKDFKGLSAPKIENKASLRTSVTGSIVMEDVFVPEGNMLNVKGMTGPFSCLNSARFGIAWGTLGAAEDCLKKTLDYTLNRKQFGHPLASYQLIQFKLANILQEITIGQEAVLALSRKKEEGTLHPTQISFVKRNSCVKALEAARTCRDVLGGNGIIIDYDVIRHMINLETVNTYEGTADVHALIIGRAMTGIQSFSHVAPHDPM